MSPKELLYIEDALGHEKFLINQCQQAAHQDLFNQFYQLV